MRSKLEKKLVPKLKSEIPKWAERLRFLHAQVLKWHEPAPLLRPESPPAPPPPPIVHEMKGAETQNEEGGVKLGGTGGWGGGLSQEVQSALASLANIAVRMLGACALKCVGYFSSFLHHTRRVGRSQGIQSGARWRRA